MPDPETPAGPGTDAGLAGGPPPTSPGRNPPRGRRGSRDRPSWWPEGEQWPPPRDGPARRGGSGGWEEWHGDGSRWRAHRGGRVGCVVAAVVVFIVGIATVGTWVLAGVLGLAGIPGSSPAAPGQVLLALLVGALLLVVLGRGARRVSMPVDDLLKAADRLAEGDYDVRVAERGPRELREAARALNTLAERLAATDQRRRALLADVSHELRTPLTVVRGGLEGMLDGLRPRDDAHLAALRDETLLLDRLIEDLRTVALAEAGALPLHLEEVEPATLIDDAVAALTGSAEAAGVRLRALPAEGLPTLVADPDRLAEVLRNLIANALRYTPAGGAIVVEGTAPDPATVVFAVTDSGAGLAPGDAERIFDRFHRAADSTGSGLGLSIARELVTAHGGSIAASSAGPGHGTTVRFTIPVAR
jgi:two-component system, OmpR family, sensor histidine kinase BaeS